MISASRTPGPEVLLEATGCLSVGDALTWLGEDHPIERGSDLNRLLRAVVVHGGAHEYAERALRRLARAVAASDLDSATFLFETETIVPASQFRATLDRLAAMCPDGRLETINGSALIAAQRSDAFTLEALCYVAGLSYKELAERVPNLPSRPSGPFGPTQLRQAFDVLDAIVRGTTTIDFPGAEPARPIELMPRVGLGRSGWNMVEELHAHGAPYEVLLSQRAVGGSWLAHRNRTSSKLAPLVADRLCHDLDEHRVTYRRSTGVGGGTSPTDMSVISGCDKQMGLVILDPSGNAVFGVIFSTARDSGTASKSASRLRAMKRAPGLPVAVVVAGPGWAARNETAALAMDFEGRLYSERSLSQLTVEIVSACSEVKEEL
jgi:hypothetical protein